ncbi:hypothetical protein G6F62_015494 [Rhizopus arrhizus]|nr:hypothetical protein G6F62_015494 [Rhizopus arrhizus]KAG1580689.1 hypothetical protein G6F46_015482 [Rhizopus delemar]
MAAWKSGCRWTNALADMELKMRMKATVLGMILIGLASVTAADETGLAGERHGTTTVDSAAVRDPRNRVDHRPARCAPV